MSSLQGKTFLVTGGTGYIGSHFVTLIAENGGKAVIIDDFSNSNKGVLDRLQLILKDKYQNVKFYEVDMRNYGDMEKVFKENKFDGVIHFAAKKAVNESVSLPLLYYDVNLCGTINMLKLMQEHKVNQMVFSSSCTVYGVPKSVPIDETFPLSCINPYGRTKLFIEDILRDYAKANQDFKVVLLRYFNPVGCHKSGLIGEQPKGVPNNIMPYIQQVAVGIRPHLNIFGDKYDTRDGTCIRDFVHVLDLVQGHVLALDKLEKTPNFGCREINLGTGVGTTVKELVAAFEKASKRKVPYKVGENREGDTVEVWCNTKLATKELGFKSKYSVEDMCIDQWRWAYLYPHGYEDPLLEDHNAKLEQFNREFASQ